MLEMLTKKRSKKRKGFTLVELIVVIAILGILMLIAVPRFQGFRENAALKADQATAATIGKAAELYRIDQDTNAATNAATVEILIKEKLIEGKIGDDDEIASPKSQLDKGVDFEISGADKADGKIVVSYSQTLSANGKDYLQLYPELAPGTPTAQ